MTESHTASQKSLINNKRVLIVTACLFGGFVIAELLGALISGSLSLLGDAAAMSVDVFSYGFNLYAEHVKERDGILTKRTRIMIELIIPSISVLALLSVTGYISNDAISTIMNSPAEEDKNLIVFLYSFASANMMVDVLSMVMFYLRGKGGLLSAFKLLPNTDIDAGNISNPLDIPRLDVENTPEIAQSSGSRSDIHITLNLNMVSALTHLSSDSLRTIAVLVAAALSSIFKWNSVLCDAWAALVVSITILLACLPLCREIGKAFNKGGWMEVEWVDIEDSEMKSQDSEEGDLKL